MSRTTQEMDRLREAREVAGLLPPTCDNCALDCSDRITGHSPCTGWHGGPGTINKGPTEEEVFEREAEHVAHTIAVWVGSRWTFDFEEVRQLARTVLREIRR
jgi:hypothetical protein